MVDSDSPSLGALLQRTETALRSGGIEAPRLQARALLGHVLGLDPAPLLARLRDPADPTTVERLRQLVRRRLAHEPLQYLLGTAHFLDFQVRVGPGVFIPRPETELLVERALELWSAPSGVAVDLCTGSGAIAIALARARPQARIVAIDQSAQALAQAAASARDTGVAGRVRFVRADLLTALRLDTEIDLVACNPPYARDRDVVQPEVRHHEPRAAWEAGPTGLEIYRRLLPQAASLLSPGTPLVLELGYDQQDGVETLAAADNRWGRVRVSADFQGIPRVLSTHRV